MVRGAAALLDRRIRLADPDAYDADAKVLWVRRRNPFERLLAGLVQRGERRVRLVLDERSAAVVATLAAAPTTGRGLAAALGLDTDEDAIRRDPDVAALVVFLAMLRRSGVIVTEPI